MAVEIHRLLHMILPPTLIENCIKSGKLRETFFLQNKNALIGQHLFIKLLTQKHLSEFLIISGGDSHLFLLSFKNSCNEQPGLYA